ncbi:MAG: DUF2079 domain-containing protein [Hydrococcus sp. Prado102]|jgi:uncharacterized membrane protein|nr:DUF2079 domain-containing protein [Hydrococcus sp. Prado102]
MNFKSVKFGKGFTISRGVAIAAVIFFVVELAIVLCRYYGYYSSQTSFDQGIFNQVFWNGIHGRFFQGSLSSSLSISEPIPDVSYHRLGQHFTPALLLWLPIYAIFPRAVTLYVLNVSLITAAGIVLYILARQRLEPKLATLITISFYGSKTLIGPTLGNFQDLCQLPLFAFGLFLALEKRSWWWFWILEILILAVREDSGILLFSIGVYLLLSRRNPWLGLAVCVLSFSYCLLVTSKVMPLFSHDVSKRFLIEEFGHFVEGEKTSSLEVLWGMISNPFKLIVEIISPFSQTFSYLVGLFLPLAFVSAISGASWMLMAFPLLALVLRNDAWMLSLSMRYVLAIVPGLFYGTILWWSHHPGAWKARLRRFWVICIGVSIFFTLTSNPNRALSFIIPDSVNPWVYASPLQQWERAKVINAYMAKIPGDVSVSATGHIVAHLSSRREMLRFPHIELINDAREKIYVNYILLDLAQLKQYQVAFADDKERLQKIVPAIDELLGQDSYGIVGYQDGIVLMQRGVVSDADALSGWEVFRRELEGVLEEE